MKKYQQLENRYKRKYVSEGSLIYESPTADYYDPNYRRVKFLRYADDTAISIIGPKSLAEKIVEEVANFLQTDLKLELNREKTQIYHTATESVPFLGYVFKTSSCLIYGAICAEKDHRTM